jgi:hypothetical protein
MTEFQILNFLNLLRPVDLNLDLCRIGSKNDGGYLVPSNFGEEIDTCFSLGIGDNDSFDLMCVLNNIEVHQFDPAIDKPPHSGTFLNFYPKAFGMFENERHLSFDEIFLLTKSESNNVMAKIDVEGGEWGGIYFSSKESLSKIKILTGEFHHFQLLDTKYNAFMHCFSKLNELFFPVFIKANDVVKNTDFNGITIPNCVEITYVSKNYVPESMYTQKSYLKDLHNLAASNDENQPKSTWHPSQYF